MAARRKHARPAQSRGKKRSSLSRWLERLDAGNPFSSHVIKCLLLAAALLAGYAILVRGFRLRIPSVVFILFAGPIARGLTASLFNYFGYRDWKKTHRGKALRKEAYIRESKEIGKIMGGEYVWNMVNRSRRH